MSASSSRIALPSSAPQLQVLARTLDSLDSLTSPPIPQGILFPQLYEFFMNPYTPLIFSVVYFTTSKYLNTKVDGKNRIAGKKWNAAIVAHNVLLAAYSAWTFVMSAPVVLGSFWRGFLSDGVVGLTHSFCDSSLSIWAGTTFPRVAYYFYLSKFWEVLDTAIILAKGKKVGMLQSYHHAGAVATMYAAFHSMAMPIWLFVVFNSFIHSLMYTYYALSAMRLPFPKFLKKNLTRLQITQFLVGGSLAASYLFISIPSVQPVRVKDALAPLSSHLTPLELAAREQLALARAGMTCLRTQHQKYAVWLNVFYLIPLTYLFVSFFISSYRKGAAAKARNAREKASKMMHSNGVSKVVKVE